MIICMFHDEETVSLKVFLFLSCLGIPICGLSNVRCVLWPHGLGGQGNEGGGLVGKNFHVSVLGRLGLSASWSFSFCLSILLAPLTLFRPSPPRPVLAIPYSLSPTFVFLAVCSSCSVFLHLSCSPLSFTFLA